MSGAHKWSKVSQKWTLPLEGQEMFQSSYSFENLVDNCFCENYDHQNSGEFNN